jgi:hypothetical protein
LADSNPTYEMIVEGKMDEPDLKLRINAPGMSNNMISYMETDEFVPIKNFVKLYRYIDSLYMAGTYAKDDNTLYISHRRDDFIMEVMKLDSIISPPPTPPSIERRN